MTRPYTEKNYAELSAGLAAGKDVNEIMLTPVPKKKPRNNEESRSQRAVFEWWNRVSKLKFGLHPCLMHSVPNGGFRNIVTASIMKAEGQKPGVYDIKLNVARGGFHGAWIEMKAEKGRLSYDQMEFMENVRAQGYFTKTCHNAKDAVAAVTDYISL